MTQKFYYKGGGVAIRKDAADSSGTHIVQDGLYAGRVPIYKIYSPSSLTIGSDTNRWTYDAFGRLQSIPAMITSQTYEVDGQTKSITYANGVTTQYFYSPTRRWVTRILTKDMNGVILMQNVYPRDVGGRIVSIDGNLARDDWAYTYDDLDRLLTATNAGDATRSETFTYALNDNMLSRTRMSGTYAYPAGNAPRPHAPTAIGARSFTYDANGNTLSDGLRTFT